MEVRHEISTPTQLWLWDQQVVARQNLSSKCCSRIVCSCQPQQGTDITMAHGRPGLRRLKRPTQGLSSWEDFLCITALRIWARTQLWSAMIQWRRWASQRQQWISSQNTVSTGTWQYYSWFKSCMVEHTGSSHRTHTLWYCLKPTRCVQRSDIGTSDVPREP